MNRDNLYSPLLAQGGVAVVTYLLHIETFKIGRGSPWETMIYPIPEDISTGIL